LFFFETEKEPVLPEEETQHVYTEMCLLVASSGPMNIDTVFDLNSNVNKIFAYSFLTHDTDISDTIWHIWYYGSDIIKKNVCSVEGTGALIHVKAIFY